MLRQALEYIVGLASPTFHREGGVEYTDRHLYIVEAPRAEPLMLRTLQGLFDYLHGDPDGFTDPDGFDAEEVLYIHIVSPSEVRLLGSLDSARRWRQCYATASCDCTEPFQTFAEIKQPARDGDWKLNAIAAIRQWLTERLPNTTILA